MNTNMKLLPWVEQQIANAGSDIVRVQSRIARVIIEITPPKTHGGLFDPDGVEPVVIGGITITWRAS